MQNLDLIISLLTYEGAATNDPADDVKVKNRIQETAITDVTRHKFPIADGTTDLSIALKGGESLYTAILCDQTISIKLNGWSTALTLTPRAAGARTWLFFTRGTVTGLTVSNASGAEANLDIISANK